jgi:hypothetical protein
MVQWGMLVFYGGAIAVGIRAWLYTTMGVPKRTLDQTDVATPKHCVPDESKYSER